MQLFFHLVYSPILYGKAKSAKRRKQQQQQQQQQKTGKEKKSREQVHVSIFKFQIQRFSCKNLQKSDKKGTKCKYTERPCQQINTSIILAKNALMFKH